MPGYKVFPQDGGVVREGLNCSYCKLVLKNPTQTSESGLRLCKECFEIACSCREQVGLDANDEVFPDKAVQKEIDKLLVKCPYHITGCEWTGQFKDCLEHLDTCECKTTTPPSVQPISVDSDSVQSPPTSRAHPHEHLKVDAGARQLSRSNEEIFSPVHYDSNPPPLPVDTTSFLISELNGLREKFDELTSQLTTVGANTNILQATVAELQQSITRIQSEMKTAHIYTTPFINRKFTWKIPALSQKIREVLSGKSPALYSPPFYTEADGYKMCLCVYLDGDGIGHKTHISVFFVVMKGEYDAVLQWPFDNKVTITLVDQDKSDNNITRSFEAKVTEHFQRPQSSMNKASGFPKFAKQSVLADPSYAKDDTMYIRAMVDNGDCVSMK